MLGLSNWDDKKKLGLANWNLKIKIRTCLLGSYENYFFKLRSRPSQDKNIVDTVLLGL